MTPAVEGLAASGLPVQALCVCGTNRKLAERLRKLPFRVPVRVYDFVKNVDVMMSAADCVVTKPGGLTVTEALAKKLPIILQTPIPGHEEQNAEFLINCNLAMRATDSMPVEELLNLMLATPALAESMRRAIDRYISPNATEHICDWLEETVKNR
jgi:processive 1,2-diacylglycerol beta-glucosyltransferase